MPGGQGFLAGVHLGDVPHQAMFQSAVPEMPGRAVGAGPGGVRTAFCSCRLLSANAGLQSHLFGVGIALL